MNRERVFRRRPLWRRFSAVVAVFALIFASIAVLPHALAAPAAMSHAHDHAGDHETDHRHGATAPGDAADGGTAPCDTGCATCKDCALCSLATTAIPASLPASDGVERYAPARVPQPADSDPARLIKPPRV